MDPQPVKESVIRMMTRLSEEHGAVNLSQGFPNEGPPWEVRMALAHSVLTGRPANEVMDDNDLKSSLLEILSNPEDYTKLDKLNQYSPPMGRPDLRKGIADYYQRFYNASISTDDITVTLGATEAFASALRTVGRPGDKCVIFEPFHELYPSQCRIFYLEPVYVTLKVADGSWQYDVKELETALKDARILMLNSPHNPTGKVFTKSELSVIVNLCTKHDVYIITDEIYEHMCYDGTKHFFLPKEFPEAAERILVCNSIGKSASATGWRVGWCLHPPQFRDTYRGIHDQLAVMSPHPMQYASLTYLTLPDEYFSGLADRYRHRADTLAQALSAVGFKVVFPQGAYYLFVDFTTIDGLSGMTSSEASMFLLISVGVACVPGDNFYGKDKKEGGKYLRFAACRSDADLEEAALRLQSLRQKSSQV